MNKHRKDGRALEDAYKLVYESNETLEEKGGFWDKTVARSPIAKAMFGGASRKAQGRVTSKGDSKKLMNQFYSTIGRNGGPVNTKQFINFLAKATHLSSDIQQLPTLKKILASGNQISPKMIKKLMPAITDDLHDFNNGGSAGNVAKEPQPERDPDQLDRSNGTADIDLGSDSDDAQDQQPDEYPNPEPEPEPEPKPEEKPQQNPSEVSRDPDEDIEKAPRFQELMQKMRDMSSENEKLRAQVDSSGQEQSSIRAENEALKAELKKSGSASVDAYNQDRMERDNADQAKPRERAPVAKEIRPELPEPPVDSTLGLGNKETPSDTPVDPNSQASLDADNQKQKDDWYRDENIGRPVVVEPEPGEFNPNNNLLPTDAPKPESDAPFLRGMDRYDSPNEPKEVENLSNDDDSVPTSTEWDRRRSTAEPGEELSDQQVSEIPGAVEPEAKPKRNGGKIAGQVSQSPGAKRRRAKRAEAKVTQDKPPSAPRRKSKVSKISMADRYKLGMEATQILKRPGFMSNDWGQSK